MLRIQDRRSIPLVGVLGASLFIFIAMVSFGVNTSCANAWSCTSSDCSPCRVVSVSAVAGLVLGGLASTWALLGRWPTRARSVIYTAAMLATAVLVLAIARSWSPPVP